MSYYEEVIKFYSNCLEENPNSKYLFWRGKFYLLAKKYDLAIKDIDNALLYITMHKDSWVKEDIQMCLQIRCLCFIGIGKSSNALEDLKTIKRMNPYHSSTSILTTMCQEGIAKNEKKKHFSYWK